MFDETDKSQRSTGSQRSAGDYGCAAPGGYGFRVLEQAHCVTHDLVGKHGNRHTDAEMLCPIGLPAKSYSAQDRASGTILVGKNGSTEFLDAMISNDHSESKDTRPVLGDRIPVNRSLAGKVKTVLKHMPKLG